MCINNDIVWALCNLYFLSKEFKILLRTYNIHYTYDMYLLTFYNYLHDIINIIYMNVIKIKRNLVVNFQHKII